MDDLYSYQALAEWLDTQIAAGGPDKDRFEQLKVILDKVAGLVTQEDTYDWEDTISQVEELLR